MFLSSIKADTGGDRSPWGSFWFEPVGMRSSTGMRVTSDTAMRLSAVYSCVRVLAETFAVLPFRLYKKRSDGGRDLVTKHWLYQLLAKTPNQYQTPFEWREMMMGHLALRGNAFNEIVADQRGQIVQLLPIHPDRIQAQPLIDGNYNYLVRQLDGSQVTLARGAVWHLRGLSSDGVVGLSPIEVATEVFGLGIAAQSYGARFFANDAKPGGYIKTTGKFPDAETKKQFSANWQSAQGGRNRGKTAILEPGMDYVELKLNNSDAQFLETRKFSRSEIASIFRVPPHKIGDLDKATFSNIEQQSLEFVNDTMTPWAERWESSIETFLMLDGDADLEVEFDFSNLLRGDSAARSAYYTSNIQNGSMTRNEARIAEGRNPLPGLDEPLRPLNMTTEADAKATPPDDQPAVIKPLPADDVAAPAPDARLQALVQASAQRLARRAAGALASKPTAEVFDAKFAALVADALAIDDDKAQRFCTWAQENITASTPDAEPTLVSRLTELGAAGQAAPDAQAVALVRLAAAISAQPAPVINLTVPERSVTVAAAQIDVHVPAPRAMQRVAVRNADGVIERIIDSPIE